ncbi:MULTISPECIES: carbohydrate ABC transporter permease [unclassified Streptomyces]|uniref:carbohydrate ABC transporter permease n=1 Tax=unclassified Streptomyces TaxID=2593676 RepID=UPI0037AE4ECA
MAAHVPSATADTSRGHPPAPARRESRRELGAAMVFIAPALFGFLVFFVWPALRGFYFSLTDWDLLGSASFVGLENYRALLTDSLFWHSLAITAEYVVINIGLQTALAIGLAVLLHRLTTSTLIRGIVLLPYLIPNVVVALMFLWMLDYSLGFGNEVIAWIGLDRIAFLGSETWAIPTIAGINVWRHLGYTALLIFAGLQTIPKDVYEAAAIDGASEWRVFTRITLPLLRPVLAMVLVMTVIGSFQIFDTIAVTTNGGPADASKVIYFYIFEKAFSQFDFGYASAMGVVLMVILALVTFVQLRLMRANESDLA